MAKNTVFYLFCKVKASALSLDTLNNPYALLIMSKALGKKLCKSTLSVVSEGSMPQVVA